MLLHREQKPFLLLLLSFTVWSVWTLDGVVSDPQTTLLTLGCTLTNVSNVSIFQDNLNATFQDMRTQISNQSKRFATAQVVKGNNPAYSLFQCRNYLSNADCLACFDFAVVQIRNCSAALNGAHITYRGCYLRYDSSNFFDQATDPGNRIHCGNETRNSTELASTVQQVISNLKIATPRIHGYFAATKTTVPNRNGSNIYAFAQCLETLSQSGCDTCLNVALRNFQICLPSSDAFTYDYGCFMRYSFTAFFADNQTTNINPFLKPGDSSKKKAIIGGVVGGASFILIFLALFAWYMRSKSSKMVPIGDILGATELKGPVTFRYKDLKTATKNFSEKNKPGEEGFGDVYKGTLKNGKVVSIKKLNLGQSKQMEKDFESEVKLIGNVHHRHIIRLLGCCSKDQERFLVYEYMKNNSVGQFLSGENKGYLTWTQRYGIILGTARGLAHLHEGFHVCIIHRDVKTSNILLDDDFQPKISDFGLAKLLARDQSHLNTQFVGTMGYVAPEYAMHGQVSKNVDTYSFGVVVLEIISGQKSSAFKVDGDDEYFLQRAWKLYDRGMHIEFIDKTLDPNEYDAEEVKKIIEIGLLCTQTSAARPRMSEVVRMLKRKSLMEHKQPTMPVYVDPSTWPRRDISMMNNSSSFSNATVSTSTLSGR